MRIKTKIKAGGGWLNGLGKA